MSTMNHPGFVSLARTSLRAAALACAAALAGCYPGVRHHQNFPVPMLPAQVAQLNTGDALVAFLRQRDASPAVCNPRATGPHVTFSDPEQYRDVVDGIHRGVPAAKWRACLTEMLPALSGPAAAAVIDRMGEHYRDLLRYPGLDESPELLTRLEALHQTYLTRPSGLAGTPAVVNDLTQQLRTALQGNRLARAGRRFGDDLLATLQLEQGLTNTGERVSLATLDGLLGRGDEALLARFADRLPQEPLRREARRRLIRLRVTRSPFAELRARAAAVEDAVLRDGRNPVSLAAHAPTSVTVDAARMPARGVVVRQDVARHVATLLSYEGDEGNTSVMPEVSLRGVLLFTVPGYSRPLTLCAAPREYDPSPCVLAGEVRLGSPLAFLEDDGSFHFVDQVTTRDALAIAANGTSFPMPVLVNEQRVVDLTWRLRFETPGDLVLAGPTGGRGPRLRVELDGSDAHRIRYTVEGVGSEPMVALVERSEAGRFHVVSSGGAGEPGMPGRSGTPGRPGISGRSAYCPSTPATDGTPGGPGGPGGDGGPAGNGGPGGEVVALVRCPGGECPAQAQLAARTILSRGGAAGIGGAAGQGGRGGAGGRGGSSATCTSGSGRYSSSYTLRAGTSAPDGPDGPDGERGPDGRPGPDGHVVIAVAPAGGVAGPANAGRALPGVRRR